MEARGYTIFCDDIRNEVGGKLTLVGCYTGEMVHEGEYPLALPKLALSVQLLMPPDNMPRTFELIVDYMPTGQVLFAVSNDLTEIDLGPLLTQPSEAEDEEDRYIALGSNITLVPFVVPQDGKLRVRAMLDGQLVKLGSLRIRKVENLASIQQT